MTDSVKGIHRFWRATLTPLLAYWTKTEIVGAHNIPSEGGFIVVPNHVSNIDPAFVYIPLSHMGVAVHYLSKAELFKVPIVGSILKAMRQVPVYRNSKNSADALAAAKDALLAGDCVGIYIEGSLTRDPQYWPMKPKTGAARLALDTHVPVIPIAQWGAQDILPRYSKRLYFRPRRPAQLIIQPPVDLSDLYSDQGSQDHEAVEEATKRIFASLVEGVETIRGEKAPQIPWNPHDMRGPRKRTLSCFSTWRKTLARRGHLNAPENVVKH